MKFWSERVSHEPSKDKLFLGVPCGAVSMSDGQRQPCTMLEELTRPQGCLDEPLPLQKIRSIETHGFRNRQERMCDLVR